MTDDIFATQSGTQIDIFDDVFLSDDISDGADLEDDLDTALDPLDLVEDEEEEADDVALDSFDDVDEF